MRDVPRDGEAARAHLLIAGRVQGVGYRAATQDCAAALGLSGWVRNLDDGRVEVLAEGPRAKLETFVGWCWRGPVFAQVTDVNTVWEPARGDLGRFGARC